MHNWTSKIARKMQASKEVWGKVFGTINTREKFLEKRLALAQHEWTRLKANDSLECRNCHNLNSMDFTRQSKRAMEMHSTSLARARRPALIVTRGLRTNCRMCAWDGLIRLRMIDQGTSINLLRGPICNLHCSPYKAYGCTTRCQLRPLAMVSIHSPIKFGGLKPF
jgi:hypothetical protein